MNKSMWNAEAVKAYESGQGVVLVEKPYPHYEPVAWNAGIPSLHPKMKEGETISVEYVELTSPQRTWVGLTDEEVWEAYMESPVELDCSTDELYALSRTVEAKLKAKNT